jgi:hypothetical protein
LLYFPIYLPFWGEWTVAQGQDGKHTHKGDWGKAFDFVLLDDESKTYASNGLVCENYYCYNKPILAPADGIVEDIIDNIDDNEIGKVNTTDNWGNTIIIRHLTGLYSQLSHLKKGTFKVVKGQFVKRGDQLASCGNSGRSPEPHLHFQVQVSSILGSRTLDYPFAYYNERNDSGLKLQQYSKPEEGAKVSGVLSDSVLKSAFDITPNSILIYKYQNEKGVEKEEKWEAFTDAYNYKYLYCKETESSAYFVNDNTMFYFTNFYGNKDSLLYYFYLTAYKVYLANADNQELKEAMPLNIIQHNKLNIWLQDFVAPFYTYIKVWHSIKETLNDYHFDTKMLVLKSEIHSSVFKNIRRESTGSITLQENSICEFTFETSKTKIKATCVKS